MKGYSAFTKKTDPPKKTPEHERYYIEPGMTMKEQVFSQSKVPTAAGEINDKINALEGRMWGIMDNG